MKIYAIALTASLSGAVEKLAKNYGMPSKSKPISRGQ
jgi:hypothetical protein